MTILCKLLACAFVVFCIVDGEVDDITKDSYKNNLNEAIVENKFEDTNTRESGHFSGDIEKNYLFDEANQGNTITQLQLKRSNSPPYNPEQSEYFEKINTPANEQKPQSKHEENFIQVPNKGGRLEKIKRVRLSSNANGQEGVKYNNNNQGESYESGHVRHGYESILDPNSGYHIISEREKNHSDEPNEGDLVISNKKIIFDQDRSQVENSKNIKINIESNPVRQVLPNIDTDMDEERKHQSHDTLYLVNPNLKKREESGEISALKDIVSNIYGDYKRKAVSVSTKVNNGYEGTMNNQMMFPRQNKAQEPIAYQQDPHNSFDHEFVNFEIENNDSSEQRYVAGDPNVESINLEGKIEYENPQGGNNENVKFANIDLEYADHKATSYDYSAKQQLPKEDIVSNEHRERTTFHHADQPLQNQNLNYGSQQLPYKSFKNAFQQQNHGYEQIIVPNRSNHHQIDDKKEEKIHISNYDNVPPQLHNHDFNYLKQDSSYKEVNVEADKEPNIYSGHNEQQMLTYEQKQQQVSNHPANKELLQPLYYMPKYEEPEIRNNYKDPDQPLLHNSHPTELFQQHDLLPEKPTFKLAKKNSYNSDINKKAIAPVMFS